jgi:hypothetical protein
MIHGKTRPTILEEAVRFADKVLLLAEDIGEREGLLSGLLSVAALEVPLNIAEAGGSLHAKDRERLFGKAGGACLRCLAALMLLRERRAIGELTHASLKADIGILCEAITRAAEAD